MISLYRDLIKGNHPIKRFHLLFFYFHKSSNDAIAIVCIFALFLAKKSFSLNSNFSLLFFEYESNFHMTLVSDSPHVALLLRINISRIRLRLTGLIHFTSERSSHFVRTSSMSLSSSASVGLDSLRYIEKEHTVHFA